MDGINKRVVENAARDQAFFQRARPFRHVVIDNFLRADFAEQLLNEFPTFDKALALNEDGVVGAKAVNEKVRSLGIGYRRLDDLVCSDEFRQYVASITGIKNLRYDPHYFGGGTHENLSGQDLDTHIDFNYHPIDGRHRRLNLILFLNIEWDVDWGGVLELHEDPKKPPHDDRIAAVEPTFNRCVIFETTEHSWHGFRQIRLQDSSEVTSRKSFALYYYSDDRPDRETALPHSTIYVERHLDTRFRPGLALSAADVLELKRMLTRRDQHIERLYRQLSTLYSAPKTIVRTQSEIPPPEMSNDDQQIVRLRSRVSELRHRLIAIESSNSWRLTRPLRLLRHKISQK